MKPETPLPWSSIPEKEIQYMEFAIPFEDEKFIIHACNAYQKLVRKLKQYHGNGFLDCEKLLRELGELP